MTNNDELALKLKAAADSATPGEWRYLKTTPFMDAEISAQNNTRVINLLAGDVTEANSEFIATANPANILALLAERDADKKRIAELEERTVSVKLPEPATEGGRGYRQKVIWVLKEACFDAGIKLEVGE